MEALGLQTLIQILHDFGPFGIVVVLWWYDGKQIRKILLQYKEDMDEIRHMYKNNVHLVEGYERVANALKDVILLSTQVNQRLVDDINGNQFCPMVRLEKKAKGVLQ